MYMLYFLPFSFAVLPLIFVHTLLWTFKYRVTPKLLLCCFTTLQAAVKLDGKLSFLLFSSRRSWSLQPHTPVHCRLRKGRFVGIPPSSPEGFYSTELAKRRSAAADFCFLLLWNLSPAADRCCCRRLPADTERSNVIHTEAGTTVSLVDAVWWRSARGTPFNHVFVQQ